MRWTANDYRKLAGEYAAHAHDPDLTLNARAVWEDLKRACLLCAEAKQLLEATRNVNPAIATQYRKAARSRGSIRAAR